MINNCCKKMKKIFYDSFIYLFTTTMNLDSFTIDLSLFDNVFDKHRHSAQDLIEAQKVFNDYFMVSIINGKYEPKFSIYEYCRPRFKHYDPTPLSLKKTNAEFLYVTISCAVEKLAQEMNIDLTIDVSTVCRVQENIAFFALKTVLILIEHHCRCVYNLENLSILALICGDLCRNYKSIIDKLDLPFDNVMLYSFNTYLK